MEGKSVIQVSLVLMGLREISMQSKVAWARDEDNRYRILLEYALSRGLVSVESIREGHLRGY